MQCLIFNPFLFMFTLTGSPLNAQNSGATSKARKTAIPTINGNVFVSCEVEDAAPLSMSSSTFTLKNGVAHIVRHHGVRDKTDEKTIKLAPVEIRRFLHLIQGVHFSTLKSSYRQEGLFDAAVETTTLKVRSRGKERVYSVSVYGGTAPKRYYKFQAAVWAFEEKHLPFKSGL